MELWEKFERQRARNLKASLRVLETLPGFAQAQVERYDKEKDALENLASANLPNHSDARFVHVLKLFDIRIEPYIQLVRDTRSLKAVVGLAMELVNLAWEEQTGTPFYQQGPQFDQITKRVRHWINEAYRRLVEIAQTSAPALDSISVEAVTVRKRRFREPNEDLLKNPDITLNRQRAAEALGISTRTLDRLVVDGTLSRTGIGTRKRFKVRDLKRILDQRNMDNRDKK